MNEMSSNSVLQRDEDAAKPQQSHVVDVQSLQSEGGVTPTGEEDEGDEEDEEKHSTQTAPLPAPVTVSCSLKSSPAHQ